MRTVVQRAACLARAGRADVASGALVLAVLVEEVEDELRERVRESDEGAEGHNVEVGHDPSVLVLEHHDLL